MSGGSASSEARCKLKGVPGKVSRKHKEICGVLTAKNAPCKTTHLDKNGRCQVHERAPSCLADGGPPALFSNEDYIRLQQQQYAPGQSMQPLDIAFRKTMACDVVVINEAIQTASDAGMYRLQKPRFQEKLQWFADMLCNCEDVTVVVYDVLKSSYKVASILPVARVIVHNPLAFNTRVRALLASENSNLWKVGANGPTWPVYEFFRVLGMKPRFRGCASTDPGKHDMLYYYRWDFTDDAAFQPLVRG